jgi:TctA family transporter
MLVGALLALGAIAVVIGLVMPFVAADPLGVLSPWNRMMLAIPGLVAGVQFFALAMILNAVNEIRDAIDPPEPPEPPEPSSKERVRRAASRVGPPPDFDE